ncbi:MAG: serine-type D-Ala-D-Ala carboxypeptidase, partial [Thiomicrorhabdus sp.]|nr:serine-type D-Ala-D-Ala carboxypeptidase [Thiomicrorhabdus sp.]
MLTIKNTFGILALLCVTVSQVASAEALPTPSMATPHVVPSAPTIASDAYLLIDINSGSVLATKNAH